jgi:hypothetical protein
MNSFGYRSVVLLLQFSIGSKLKIILQKIFEKSKYGE